jgi:hypothetical protein
VATKPKYKNIEFRSFTEARWAAWFDLAGWIWTYEPQGFGNYIPDFVIPAQRPLLVEVKAEYGLDEMHKAAKTKLYECGWEKEVLILGATMQPYVGKHTRIPECFGLLGERVGDTWDWAPAILSWTDGIDDSGQEIPLGAHFGVHHYHGDHTCRICFQKHVGISNDELYRSQALHNEAHNLTKWRFNAEVGR